MESKAKYMALLVLAVAVGSAGLASAFGMGFASEDQRAAITQAIENNDFESWKAAMTGPLTQENFDKIVERHNAMSKRMGLQKAVTQAVEDGNYEAYLEAVENLRNSYTVTEEEFNAMVERYNAGAPMERFGHRCGFKMHRMGW